MKKVTVDLTFALVIVLNVVFTESVRGSHLTNNQGNEYSDLPARNTFVGAQFVGFHDCNSNGIPDSNDIAEGTSNDCNTNGVPDDCDILYDHDCCVGGHGASCSNQDIASCVCQLDPYCCNMDWDRICVALVRDADCGSCPSKDLNFNSVPDECDPDCNTNGIPDSNDIAEGTSNDCNSNGIPDECEPNQTWYVDDDAPLGGDGQSWDTAYTYLQDALQVCIPGDVIRVAGGTYKPDQDERGLIVSGDRDATFRLINAVELFGGYAGTGSVDPNQRNIDSNVSVLSGDLNDNDIPVDFAGFIVCFNEWNKPLQPGCEVYDLDDDQDVDWADLYVFRNSSNRNDNSYHVVSAKTLSSQAVLNGFTISGGNAYANYPDNRGGGILSLDSKLTITNCTLFGNAASSGGGLFCQGDSSLLSSSNCLFNENWADGGGGVSISDVNSVFTNCTFTMNVACEGGGTEIYSYFRYLRDPRPKVFTNCYFISNIACNGGGGMLDVLADEDDKARSSTYLRNSEQIYYLQTYNCLFAHNKAFGEFGGGGIMSYFLPPPPHIRLVPGEASYYDANSGRIRNTPKELRWPPPFGHIVTNCTIVGNQAEYGRGGGISFDCWTEQVWILANCIFWNNRDDRGHGESAQINGFSSSVTNCCIQELDTYTGNGNFGVNPMFVNVNGIDDIPGTVDYNLRLQSGSPCRNTGDNTAIPEELLTDLDDQPRLRGCFVDLGAYEYQDDNFVGDVNNDCIVDLEDYYDFNFCLERFGYERNPILDACLESFDFNADEKIDLADFAGFQSAFGRFAGS